MGVDIELETNDIKEICKFLEYALEQYKKAPRKKGWNDTLYNEMRIRQLQQKLKNNKKYIDHERIVKVLKTSRDAGIDLEKETI